MNSARTNNNTIQSGSSSPFDSIRKLGLFVRRHLKLNRFLLVIDIKKGLSVAAISVIVVDLIDLLWNLSMTFGPLNSSMTTLLLVETLLVICVCGVLLYNVKSENRSEVKSIMFTWLLVVAIDYCLRLSMCISSLIISEKASMTAKAMKSIAYTVMFTMVAHCWLCVFTCYDDNNGSITKVKITPSDAPGSRSLLNKRPLMLMGNKSQGQNSQLHQDSPTLSSQLRPGSEMLASNSEHVMASNMLRAPGEELAKSRW